MSKREEIKEKYEESLMQWAITKILITSIILIGAFILCIIGFAEEKFMELISSEISLFVIWFLVNKILDTIKTCSINDDLQISEENKDE